MDLALTDKAAIVTGSSRGLGLASARALVAEGCRVCICARGPERLAEAAIEVEAAARRPNMVLAVQADVSTQAGVDLVVARTVETFGRLDVLVNNVGLAGGAGLLDTTDAEWQAAFDLTLFPAIRASRAAVPHMREAGGGAIIMIASIYGREAGGRMTYNAVKAAEISLAKSLAQQLAPFEHSRQQSGARLHPLSRGIVAPAAAGRSRGDCRVRQARAAVWSLRSPRRDRCGRHVPRIAARQLDQRCVDRRRWRAVTLEYLNRMSALGARRSALLGASRCLPT